MSHTVPSQLKTTEVLAHLRIGRDALRALVKDSEAYGIFCPRVNIARLPRKNYRWGTGRDNPYREITRWFHAVAESRKCHDRRYPNGYHSFEIAAVPDTAPRQGRRRSRLRELLTDLDEENHG